jgi:ribonuclease PH
VANLKSVLGEGDNREKVVKDCVDLIEGEVKDKGGLSGMAIKAGYKMVNGIKPTFVKEAVDHMLNEFADKLDPIYQEAKSGGKKVAEHFVASKSRAAEALLSITDEKSKRAKSAAVVKTYQTLRGSAKDHVEAAMPRLGKLIEKYDSLRYNRPMPRKDGRAHDAPRPVEIIPGFHTMSEGSCLYRAGRTVVLCVASVDESVPKFLDGKGTGWVTAEYQMHPRINPVRREARDGRGKPPSGRTQEIQRLVGRALRAAVDLARLGPRTITVDCDVLEADGGTRTASITGGFVALAIALERLRGKGVLPAGTSVLRDQVAAVSVGHVGGELLVDLCYDEDSTARVDLNMVATARGGVIEVQGTAEGEAVSRAEIDRMMDLATHGIGLLAREQCAALARAGVPMPALGASA